MFCVYPSLSTRNPPHLETERRAQIVYLDIIFLPEILSRLQRKLRSKRTNQPPQSALALSYRRIREAPAH